MTESKKKSGKVLGRWCSICEEKRADYAKNGKLVCSGCKEFPANTSNSFFNFSFKDCVSNIQVKGFHPSPLNI